MTPLKGPRLASCVASGTTEKQGHCQVCRTEVPGHRQLQLTQTLIVRLLKMHFLSMILDFEKSTEYI